MAFDGRQQRRALEALQEQATAAGRSVTVIAGELGLSDGQYRRYLWGKVPLRTDQLGPFAIALGTSRRQLIEGLGLLSDDPADAAWSFREFLRAHLPDDVIARHADLVEGLSIKDQRAVALELLDMAAEARARTTPPDRKSQTA